MTMMNDNDDDNERAMTMTMTRMRERTRTRARVREFLSPIFFLQRLNNQMIVEAAEELR